MWLEQKEFRSKYSSFTIDSFHLDFDGKKFRLVQDKYEIPRYSGEIPIISLKVFPLCFLPEPTKTETMNSLLERGQNFRSLTSVDAAHREYRGMSLDPEREEIDGRVIVDFRLAPLVGPPLHPEADAQDNGSDTRERIFGLRPLSQTKETEVTEVIGRDEEPDVSLYNDHTYDSEKTEKLFLVNRVLLAPSYEMSSAELTANELRLLPGTVYAYVLRSRKYCERDLQHVVAGANV